MCKNILLIQKNTDTIHLRLNKLTLDLYLTVIDDIEKLIIKAGKKPYLISIGKPNVAKLSNFLEIECFCLVSCKDNSLLDSREFMVPLVTPFELGLALSGKDFLYQEYDLDISSFVDAQFDVEGSDSDGDENESPEPHFSLVTGKLVDNKKYSQRTTLKIEYEDSQEVVKRTGTVLKIMDTSAGADYLNTKRTFKGLDLNEAVESMEIETGRSGIAGRYSLI